MMQEALHLTKSNQIKTLNYNLDSQPEPAPKQSTVETSKPGGFKEPTPPAAAAAPTKEASPPSAAADKAAVSAAASREPTPLMSESSKHASPEHFNHKSETVKV